MRGLKTLDWLWCSLNLPTVKRGRLASWDSVRLSEAGTEKPLPSCQHFSPHSTTTFPQVPSNKYRLALLLSFTAWCINHFHNYNFWGAPWLNGQQHKYSSSCSLLASYLGLCWIILGCFRHLLLRLKSLLAVRRALVRSWLLLVSSCLYRCRRLASILHKCSTTDVFTAKWVGRFPTKLWNSSGRKENMNK